MGQGRLRWSSILPFNTYSVVGTDGVRISESGTSVLSIPQTAAPRDFYFNSLEPGAGIVGTNPNYLMTDDFSRGAWYEVDADHSGNPMGTLTCGWYGNIYENPITPTNAVVGGGVGLHGRQFAASSGFMDGTPGGRNMASHEFVGNAEVDEAYFRIYFKVLPGYIGGHEKQFDFIRGNNNGGLVALSYIWGGQSVHYIPYLHQDDGRPSGQSSWMGSNLAPEINPLIPDHWYFMEMHVILNTPGVYNGVYEWWMDDCGVDGRSGPTTPTRRGYYNDVLYRNSAESAVRLGGIWIENWANPGSTGTEYYANIIVSRAGPIGFAPTPNLNWLANKPANFTNIWTDYPFNDPIPVGGDTLVVPGGFWHQVFNSGYLSRVADNTGPISPGYVLQNHNYPGMPSGGGSGGLYGYIANGTTEVYVSLMSKWDSNYEWNAISNKFFIFEPDHIIIESNHNTGQWWTVEWSNPNTFLTSNIASTPITLGVWHNVEILLRRGPSGRIRIWVDGILQMDHSVAIPLTVEPYEQTMNLANTWGGATGPTTRDSYRWTDHVYIATP